MSALVFYDMFDYPLTLLEIWKFTQYEESFLSKVAITLGDVLEALTKREFFRTRIIEQEGFYMLKGREDLFEMRLGRHNKAQVRWRKATKLIRWLGDVPFLKMVAMCNMCSIDTPSLRSDIDVVIVAKDGRIWLVRLIVTFLIAITGQWRHRKVAGKMCLSFFLTDKNLDLQKLYKEKGVWQEPDPYLNNWTAVVAPILDRDGTADKFFEANDWVHDFLPNSFPYEGVGLRQVHSGLIARGWRRFWEFVWGGAFGDWVEKSVRWWQMEYMKARGDQEWLKNPNVIRSDEVLKFHEIDRREHFREEFMKRLQEVYR